MVKNKVILSGLLVAGFMAVPVQANDYVDRAKAPLAFFAGASAARNSVEWLVGKRKAGQRCPVAGFTSARATVGKDASSLVTHNVRALRVGSYSVGFRTPATAASFKEAVTGLRPVVDGFTLSNVVKDAAIDAAAWYAVQNGYVPAVKIPGLSR